MPHPNNPLQAGRATRDLFSTDFWNTVANENIVQNCLGLCCLGVGATCALAGAIVGTMTPNPSSELAIVGLVAGLMIATIQASVLKSGITTVYICFALDAAVLKANRPESFSKLTSAWAEMGPETLIMIGGAGFAL